MNETPAIRIGQIGYANCTPIFHTLTTRFDCCSYQFIRGVPAELNQMLRRAEIDLCPSSSIEFAKSPASYYLLPNLSISSVGPVKSVLLFSRLPIEELDNHPIGLTTESDTSVNLLKILLARAYGFTNEFHTSSLPLHDAVRTTPALLLIGDKALKMAMADHRLFVYDLGELWYKFTGLPFVFALWLVTRRAVEEKGKEMRLLRDRLVAAKQYACETYAEIAACCEERSWMSSGELVEYWHHISYELTAEHLRGVSTFFRFAAELGLVAEEPVIRLLDDDLSSDVHHF